MSSNSVCNAAIRGSLSSAASLTERTLLDPEKIGIDPVDLTSDTEMGPRRGPLFPDLGGRPLRRVGVGALFSPISFAVSVSELKSRGGTISAVSRFPTFLSFSRLERPGEPADRSVPSDQFWPLFSLDRRFVGRSR